MLFFILTTETVLHVDHSMLPRVSVELYGMGRVSWCNRKWMKCKSKECKIELPCV